MHEPRPATRSVGVTEPSRGQSAFFRADEIVAARQRLIQRMTNAFIITLLLAVAVGLGVGLAVVTGLLA